MAEYYFEKPEILRSIDDFNNFFPGIKIIISPNTRVILSGRIIIEDYIEFNLQCECKNIYLGFGSKIINSKIGNQTKVRSYSIIENSSIGDNCTIGPNAFIRDKTHISANSIIGANVEVARSICGENVQVAHFAFLGDAKIDNRVIIGAGVVFSNYFDGARSQTVIGENTLIGSNSTIVAPVKIGKSVIVGAASLITKDVDDFQKIIQKRTLL